MQVLLKCKEVDIDHRDNDSRSAIYLACLKGNLEIVVDLIQHSADINSWTPLQTTFDSNHMKVVRELLNC